MWGKKARLVCMYIFIWNLFDCCLGCGVPRVRYRSNFVREMRPGEFPWQVQLQLNWKYLCGGVILNRWWVVTTAHCIFMFSEALFESLVIVAGTLQVENMQIIYGVHKVILHEYFMFDLSGFKISDNDIALVLVKEPFVFNKLVSPICFPEDRQFDMDTVENCWVTGWQMISLARGPIPPIYHMVKQNVGHEKLEICEKFFPENLRENVICMTNRDKRQSLCMGGYGAPLECQDKRTKVWIIAGAASFCRHSCNHTALFTRFSHYADWVERSTIIAGRPFHPYGLPPKPTVSCQKIKQAIERSSRWKPARRWEQRRKWKKNRPHKVVFESSSSSARWVVWPILGAVAYLVQLVLLD